MRTQITARRAAAASAVALALVLGGCAADDGSSNDGTAEVSFQTSWIPVVQFGGSYLADAEGYYTDEDLDVTILPGGPDVDPVAAVAAGQADIGLTQADILARANEQGADLVGIAAGFQANPLAVLSLASDPIESPEEMVGRSIGVQSGNLTAHEAILTTAGVDPSSVPTVPVGFDISPLTSGEVAGLYVYYTEQPVALELTGEAGTTFLAADYGLDVYSQVYVVQRAALEDEERRDAITRFLRAEIKGWQDYVADPEKAVELTLDVYARDGGLSPEGQSLQAARQLELLQSEDTEEHGLLWISDTRIAENIAALENLGVTADESLFDTSILEAVYEGGNRVE